MQQRAPPPRPGRDCRGGSIPPGHGLTSAVWNRQPADQHLPRVTRWLRRIPEQERTNTLAHVFGALFSALPGGALVLSLGNASPALRAAVAVFVCALCLVYSLSALHHAGGIISRSPLCRAMDRSVLFVLAAATLTPLATALGGIEGAAGTTGAWLAAVAVVVSHRHAGRWHRAWRLGLTAAAVLLLLAATWLSLRALDPGTLAWLAAGAVAYAAALLFRALSPHPFMHTLWHGLLVLGSALHLIAVAALATALTH